MLKYFRTTIVLLAALTFLTGVVYPCVVTAVAQIAFPHRANGSMIMSGERAVGSELIGQAFSGPDYFWGRLSATTPFPYNAAASSGSNFGPLHPQLTEFSAARIVALGLQLKQSPGVPVDLVTASASGLDPHITPAAADFQVHRVATSRKMSERDVRELIRQHTEQRQFGLLGEPRVNVLELNLALDDYNKSEEQHRP